MKLLKEAQELKGYIKKSTYEYTKKLFRDKAKELKKKAEEGCGVTEQEYGNVGIKLTCGKKFEMLDGCTLCNDCQEAIKICEEILK